MKYPKEENLILIQFPFYPKILKTKTRWNIGWKQNWTFPNDPEYFYCKITFCWQKDKILKNDTYVKRIKQKSASLVTHAYL